MKSKFIAVSALLLIALLLSTSTINTTSLSKVFIPLVHKYPSVPLGTAVQDKYLIEPLYANTVSNYYNIISPENEAKYYFVSMNGWSPMDNIVQFAEDHNLKIHACCVAWNFWTQPEDYLLWTMELTGRYTNIITDWDVINEGYDPYGTPTLDNLETILQTVKVSHPEIRRWYNGILDMPGEQQAVIALVEKGLVQAVGIQLHANLFSDFSVYVPLLEYLNSHNIPWRVSEFEVYIPNTSNEMLIMQADKYREALNFAITFGAESFTTWGFTDGVSWQAQNFPLPFFDTYVPKPAWRVLYGGD